MVEAGVSQEELKQILTQLRAMGRTNSAAPPPQSMPQNSFGPPQHASYHANPAISAPVPHAPAVPQMPVQYGQPQPVFSGATSLGAFGVAGAAYAQMQPGSSTSTPDISQTPASSASGINNLFQSLMKAGLVSSGSTPTGASSASTDAAVPHVETPEELRAKEVKRLEDEKLDAQKAYAKSILSMKIRLSTSEITRYVSPGPPNLYRV